MRKPVVTKVTTKGGETHLYSIQEGFALKQVTAQRNDGTPMAAITTEPDSWVFDARQMLAFNLALQT